MKIEAAIAYRDQTEFTIEPVELDGPQADEILVKIAGVGICHTDLFVRDLAAHIFKHPAVLGHEGAGIVEAIGENISKVKVGDKVAITFSSCGTCANCERGPAAYCENFQALNMSGMRSDGSRALSNEQGELEGSFFGQSSFATHCLTSERNVVKVADGIPVEIAGPLGCGIQTGAGAILNSLDVEAGTGVMISGGGPVGQSAVMAAKLRGCTTIILVEPQESRREFALKYGATHVIDPMSCEDISAKVREIEPRGLDYAFDTTGLDSALDAALKSLKPKGALGMVGMSPTNAAMPATINNFAAQGLRVIGIIEGDSEPDEFLPYLMEQHLAGHLPFDKMVKTYPFADINRAIAEQHDGQCIKAVLTFD